MPTAATISVIVTADAEPELLERAVCSVLDTGYEGLEVVVVGEAEAAAAEVLSIYADEVTRVATGESKVPTAVNAGLAATGGEVVAVMRGDMLLLPGAVQDAAAGLLDVPGASALAGGALRLGPRDESRGRVAAELPGGLGDLLHGEVASLPGVMFYRREALQRQGGFDVELPRTFVHEMNCRLMTAGEAIATLGAVLSAVRDGADTADDAVLANELERVAVGLRYASRLGLPERERVRDSLEEQRRVLELAASQAGLGESRRFLWRQLLRRPQWLADARYRRTLLEILTPGVRGEMRLAA